MKPVILKTKRLLLRPWKAEDFEAFAKLNADPRVMEFFPSTLTRKESDEIANRRSKQVEEQGWGLWAVEIPGMAEFIGFIGIIPVPFETHFTPAVEVGWRLAHEFWGKGYALEGAQACLKFGFETLHLEEIVSMTVPGNKRSIRVMEKLGMHRNPSDDFDHPKVPEGSPFKRHVLYRIQRREWAKAST